MANSTRINIEFEIGSGDVTLGDDGGGDAGRLLIDARGIACGDMEGLATPAQARAFAKAILKAADEVDPPEVKEGDTVRWIDTMLEGVVMNNFVMDNAGHCDHLHVVVTRDDGSRRIYYIERHKVFKVSDG